MNTNHQTRRACNIDPGNLVLFLYTATMTLLVLLGWLVPARATTGPSPQALDEVRRGELLYATGEQGQYRAAPQLSMDVEIVISGIAARTTLKQRFKNDSPQWVEALYVFPLPEQSAVDHLQMQVGDRIITGKIKEKQEARRTYEAAKSAGKKASLLSQHRPNLFTTSVANIAPGETVTIEIQYQQLVQRHENIFSLRFPLVVGPRYRPGACTSPGPATDLSSAGQSTGVARKGGSRDLPRITSRDVVGSGQSPVNPVQLRVRLDAGFVPARIESLYHGITTRREQNQPAEIQFNGKVMADRDFVLEWEAPASQAPAATLFSEQKNGTNYMLLMVMPPMEAAEQEPLARETIFVLDTSGSMGGPSIRQAKKALGLAVSRMRARDRFNIIEFNSTTNTLFAAGRPGTPENRRKALEFIKGLTADGGTKIRPALELALDGRDNHARIRQVVFLTDAWVSNEEELFQVIHQQLGDSRLFMVGIGSAPNSYFMNRAAEMGRGSSIFIGKPGEVGEKMARLFTMLEQPAVTDLALQGANIEEMMPARLPDLYRGEPLLVLLKSDRPVDRLTLSGLSMGLPWQAEVDGRIRRDRPGISVLWARKKIKQLMDSLAAGASAEAVKKEVTRLALENHLVSRYTSMVAVEERVSRPNGSPLHKTRQKTNLPAGTRPELIFGGSAATATPATALFCTGLLLLAGAVLLAGKKATAKRS